LGGPCSHVWGVGKDPESGGVQELRGGTKGGGERTIGNSWSWCSGVNFVGRKKKAFLGRGSLQIRSTRRKTTREGGKFAPKIKWQGEKGGRQKRDPLKERSKKGRRYKWVDQSSKKVGEMVRGRGQQLDKRREKSPEIKGAQSEKC